MSKTITTSRANCVCQPLFGSTCLLPEFFDFSGVIPCVCPEADAPSGKVQLFCSAYCKKPDGSRFIRIMDQIGNIGFDGGNCTFGWQYICDICSGNKILIPDIGPGTNVIPACGDYCCGIWGGIRANDGSYVGPSTSPFAGTAGCTAWRPGQVCVGAVWLYIGSQPGTAKCKHGPKLIYTDGLGRRHGACNWMASVFLYSPFSNDWCTGPCWMPAMSGVNDLQLIFAVDCGNPDPATGQNNVHGCNPAEPPASVALHMNLIGWASSATGGVMETFTCAPSDLADCYMDFSQSI